MRRSNSGAAASQSRGDQDNGIMAISQAFPIEEAKSLFWQQISKKLLAKIAMSKQQSHIICVFCVVAVSLCLQFIQCVQGGAPLIYCCGGSHAAAPASAPLAIYQNRQTQPADSHQQPAERRTTEQTEEYYGVVVPGAGIYKKQEERCIPLTSH